MQINSTPIIIGVVSISPNEEKPDEAVKVYHIPRAENEPSPMTTAFDYPRSASGDLEKIRKEREESRRKNPGKRRRPPEARADEGTDETEGMQDRVELRRANRLGTLAGGAGGQTYTPKGRLRRSEAPPHLKVDV